MNWIRTRNREWTSACGRYQIQAMPYGEGFEYAAMHISAMGHKIGLGLFRGPDSLTNAQSAKAACQHHQERPICS